MKKKERIITKEFKEKSNKILLEVEKIADSADRFVAKYGNEINFNKTLGLS